MTNRDTESVVSSTKAYYEGPADQMHAGDKSRVLSECRRVLAPSGTLVFTDILVRSGTNQADRQRIYDRVKSPDMCDIADYTGALDRLGFVVVQVEDWSEHVARSYKWVRDEVLQNKDQLLRLVDADTFDGTVDALSFWIEAAHAGKIGWALFVAKKTPF